jgi:hypothetical protein
VVCGRAGDLHGSVIFLTWKCLLGGWGGGLAWKCNFFDMEVSPGRVGWGTYMEV